jgi:hypothetical protein
MPNNAHPRIASSKVDRSLVATGPADDRDSSLTVRFPLAADRGALYRNSSSRTTTMEQA